MTSPQGYEGKAREIATKAHDGQFRWDGVTPYITHPKAVAAAVDTDEEKAVAWLHDVFEDTEITAQDLVEFGIPRDIVQTVLMVTKVQGESYLNYLLRVKCSAVATKVKIADIKHNLSDLDRKKNKQRYEKYQLAKHILSDAATLRSEAERVREECVRICEAEIRACNDDQHDPCYCHQEDAKKIREAGL